jgi:hypothetical protein
MEDEHPAPNSDRTYASDLEQGNVFGSSPSERHSFSRLDGNRAGSIGDEMDSDVAVDEEDRNAGMEVLGLFSVRARSRARVRSDNRDGSDSGSALDEGVDDNSDDHGDDIAGFGESDDLSGDVDSSDCGFEDDQNTDVDAAGESDLEEFPDPAEGELDSFRHDVDATDDDLGEENASDADASTFGDGMDHDDDDDDEDNDDDDDDEGEDDDDDNDNVDEEEDDGDDMPSDDEDAEYSQFFGVEQEMLSLMEQRGSAWMEGMPAAHLQALRRADIQAQRLMQRFRNADDDMEVFVVWRNGQEAGEILADRDEDASLPGLGIHFLNMTNEQPDWAEGFGLGIAAANAMLLSDPSSEALRPYAPARLELPQPPRVESDSRSPSERNLSVAGNVLDGLGSRRHSPGATLGNILLYGSGAHCQSCPRSAREALSALCRSDGLRALLASSSAVAPTALMMRRNISCGDCGLRNAADARIHDFADLVLRSPAFTENLGHGIAAAYLVSKMNPPPKESEQLWDLASLGTVLAGAHFHPLFWDGARGKSSESPLPGLYRAPPALSIRFSEDLLEALLGLPIGPLLGIDRFGTLAVTGTRQRRRDVLRLYRAFGSCSLRRGAPYDALSGLDTHARHLDTQQKRFAALHEEMRTLWRDERVRRERAQLDDEYRRLVDEEQAQASESCANGRQGEPDVPMERSEQQEQEQVLPAPGTETEAASSLTGSLLEHASAASPSHPASSSMLTGAAETSDSAVVLSMQIDDLPGATQVLGPDAPEPAASGAVELSSDAEVRAPPVSDSTTDQEAGTRSITESDMEHVARTVGIDPTVLVELPPDLRREVIQQNLAQIRSNPAFLSYLPVNVRQEVEEAAAQLDRIRGSAAEMDNASFLATLPTALREEIYLTSDESFLQSLPPHLAAEARAVRDRRRSLSSASAAAAAAAAASASFLGPNDLTSGASEISALMSTPQVSARKSCGLVLVTQLDVLEKALRSPGVCCPLLANTVRLLCYEPTTRMRIIRLAWRLVECQRPDDASTAGRSAELVGSLLRFSPTIALDLVAADGDQPLMHLLQSIPKAVRFGGRHCHRLLEVLLATTSLFVQLLRGQVPQRGLQLEPAQPDASMTLPVVPPVVAPGVLNDLAIALQVPDLSARSWDRLLSIYEYLYGEEQNRDTVIQCLVQIAGALIEPVCAAIREEPGLRPCESFFVQTVKSVAQLVRPHLECLQVLEPVWTCLEEQLAAGAGAGPPVRLSRLIECYLQAHSIRLPDLLADLNQPPVLESNPSLLARSESASTLRSSTTTTTTTTTTNGVTLPESVMAIDRELASFLERHTLQINQLLQLNPALFRQGFQSTLLHARFLEFENKKVFFRHVIQEQRRASRQSPVRLLVRRDCVFEDSYHQLRPRSAAELRGTLTVQFVGEEGIDAGGLLREWYVILARKIFDENYALFRRCVGKSAAYHINECSYINEDHLGFFKFIGRFIGKALWDGQLLDAYFARSVYKHMIGIRPSYHDIEAIDPEYYASLVWMLEHNIAHVLDLTMAAELDQFGELKVVDLVPGGRHIPVTEENKWEYVRLITELKMTKAVEPQLQAFLEGFHEMVPRSLIAMFSDYELELLISGLPEIDTADLKMHTTYSGYRPSSPQIQWFWQAVAEMDRDDRARLVMFVTGSSKVPLGGFANLPGMNGGVQRFQIHRVAGDTDRLPSAHTCFNQLDLPEYSSYEKLRERLLTAVREGNEGFGFG